MVTTKESQTCQQFSAWNSPNLDHMALLQLEQNYSLPYFPPAFTANVGFPGQLTSGLCSLNSSQPSAVGGSFKLLRPSGNPCLEDSQCALPHKLGFPDKPIDASCAPQKKFLIFDRSGDQTRLFFSPSLPPKDQTIAPKTPANTNGFYEKFASEQQFLVKPVVEENWDENHLNDGESEMLEDSEEINALLYSDSDDESDDYNDEVTSTRDTPFIIEEGYDKDKSLEELMEEVASSDGSLKRQRLLDGRYNKSSVRVESYEDDAESSYGVARNSDDDIDSSKREKKVKARDALKILESIIPGLESKDPLSIIDKAIIYLESMKSEAEALGVGYPECISATFY